MMAATCSFLRNSYWVLRHGRSIPNEKGLIVSSLENGIQEKFQLTPEGVNQAQLAGELFQKKLKLADTPIQSVRICYSPFSRTTHTAKVVASILNLQFEGPQCYAMNDIRERYFGPSFELMPHDKYAEIWDLDENDPLMAPSSGESVCDVASRLANAMATMESKFEGCTILIVSHGDPLQILQAIINAAANYDTSHPSTTDTISSIFAALKLSSVLSQHRDFALLNGQLRRLI